MLDTLYPHYFSRYLMSTTESYFYKCKSTNNVSTSGANGKRKSMMGWVRPETVKTTVEDYVSRVGVYRLTVVKVPRRR